MKIPLIVVVLFALPMPIAAQTEQHNLKSLLQDASYVLNRFDEAASGLDIEIEDLNIPASTKMSFKGELSAVLRRASAEKPRLNALIGENDISSTDLFDVYEVMVEVGDELFAQSDHFSRWGNDAKGVELAQVGSKAWVLAGNIRDVLRPRIQAQEHQLERCSGNPPPAAKHK